MIKLGRDSVAHLYIFSFNQNILGNKNKLIINIQGVSKQMRKTSGGDSLFKIKGSLLYKRWVKSQPLGRYRGTKMAEK